jgi:AcrR family transcriptional regulator
MLCQVKLLESESVPKRAYEQRLRAETAEENRQRILDALYERLAEAPAQPISVDEVARRARVSRSTVYLAFGSRSGLFAALTERLLRGAGYDRILEAVRAPDARETLRGGLEGGVQLYAAHRDVLRVLHAMAKLDPAGAGQGIARAERDRADGMAWLANRLDEQKVLRPGLTPAHAAHMFWLFASFDAYDLLASGRGLRPEEIVDILTRAAEGALLTES